MHEPPLESTSEPSTAPLEAVGSCLVCGSHDRRTEVETAAMMRQGHAGSFSFVRCADCGLVQLDPRVPASQLAPWYGGDYLPFRGPAAWGRFAPLVASDLKRTDRARVATLRRFIDLGPEQRVWDVGCGKPTFLEALVAATRCRAVGTDFTDEGWRDEPRRWHGMSLVAGEVVPGAPAGDVREIAIDDLGGPVDAVTMWHYLEHEYRPRALLERVRERVRPGGVIVIEVPDHDSWTRRRYGRWWQGYHTPRHTALYTPSTLRRLLESTGWVVEHQEQRGTLDAYALDWMSRMERRGIDWTASMEPRFAGFVAGMLRFRLRHLGRRGLGLGVQTAVARAG
jgi:cyclopropane fatty-acyl-phospholipid synthase-like methyltransferase